MAFQGASYFRALGRNSAYGLSARGLAVNTGLSVAAMPVEKVRALAWFVLTLIVLAGGAMAWLVGTFRIDAARVAAVNAKRNG